MVIHSECVLIWANRIEVQRAHAVVIKSLHEVKNLVQYNNREKQDQPHLLKCLNEGDADTVVRLTN